MNRNLSGRVDRLERSAPVASDGPFSPSSVLLLVLAEADPDGLTAEERERALAVRAAWADMLEQVRANPNPTQRKLDELRAIEAESLGQECDS